MTSFSDKERSRNADLMADKGQERTVHASVCSNYLDAIDADLIGIANGVRVSPHTDLAFEMQDVFGFRLVTGSNALVVWSPRECVYRKVAHDRDHVRIVLETGVRAGGRDKY